MSFTWRYVVRPDASFCRVGNVDGSLDNTSDEELARLRPERHVDDSRPGPAPAVAAGSCSTGTARS
ncbi:hypothetical protein [Streptomyces sp. NPDC095817]|uniref:hypothetical protein n=1 Tax=Streptomyces sp. NPDC095817 TaxID=3155082 RepID=UPI00331F2A07